MTNAAEAARAGAASLRAELAGRVEAAVAGMGGRVEALDVAVRQHTADLQALRSVQAACQTEAQVGGPLTWSHTGSHTGSHTHIY